MGVRERVRKPDYIMVGLIIAMIVIGLLMVYSASVVSSFNTTNDPNFYFNRHLMYVALGLGVFYVASRIKYTFWKGLAPLFLVGALLMSVLVFIPGIGMNHGGADRWINIGSFTLQPSEFLKLGVVLYMAFFFERVGRGINTMKAFLPFVVALIIIGVLVMAQPDLGTFTVIATVSVVMFFTAGGHLLHIGTLVVAGIGGIIALIAAAPYRMQRFLVFLNPSADTSGAGYQINQALIAIGTGGLFGLGFNQSRQKYQYLPEAQTDSIVAVMAEELGFIRMVIFIAILVFLILKGMDIARRAPDVFSKLLVVGVITWVGYQSIVNIGAMTSLLPLTGVPLPFISFGGTSLIVLLFAFGIVVNISRYASGGKKKHENNSSRRRERRSHFPVFGSR